MFGGTFTAADNATLGRWNLDYEFLIAGLSPIEGEVDGSSALNTPWRVNRSFFRFESPDENHQSLITEPRDHLSYDAVPGGEDSVALQQICFGQHDLTLSSDPNEFLLYAPQTDIDSNDVVAGSPDLPGAAYNFYDSDIIGFPRTFDDRSDEVTLRATLPEGLVYTFRPNVRIVRADGEDSWVSLDVFEVQSALSCGQVVGHCLEINDFEGSYTGLTIGIEPELPYCNETGTLAFGIVVDSTNQIVDGLRTQVFKVVGGAEVLVEETFHCAPCGPNVETTFSANLDTGQYRLQIDASSGVGTCDASFSAPFIVPNAPLALQCAEDFAVTLSGGTQSISSDDPAIAALLTANTSGGCGFDVQISDNRPAAFLEGETPVTFEAGDLSCETTVTVTDYGNSQIAFITGETLHVYDIGTGDQVHSLSVSDLAKSTSFSADGQRIALTPAAEGAAALLYNFDTDNFESVPGTSGKATSFSPNNENVAIISNEANQFILSVHTEDSVHRNSFIAGLNASTPAIAWSPNGDRIGLVLTVANTPTTVPTPLYRVRYREYTFDGQSLTHNSAASFEKEMVPPPLRHEPFELVFVPGASPVYSSTTGFLRVIPPPIATIEQIEMGIDGPNGPAFDISNNGSGAAWAGSSNALHVIPDLTNLDPATLISGARDHIVAKPELAVSNDMRLLALTKPDAVVVLSIPDFEVVQTIPATAPRGLQFRPRPEE